MTQKEFSPLNLIPEAGNPVIL